MTISALEERGATGAEIARLLGVCEGAVRYHVGTPKARAVDGRSAQAHKAAAHAEAIEHWRQSTENAGLNLAALHLSSDIRICGLGRHPVLRLVSRNADPVGFGW
ncbi:MAG: hypothetical protein AAF844_04465 [Pseudomonadota bacterium]